MRRWAVSILGSPENYGHLCFKDLIWNHLGQFPLGVNDEGKLLGSERLPEESFWTPGWTGLGELLSSLVVLRSGTRKIQEPLGIA